MAKTNAAEIHKAEMEYKNKYNSFLYEDIIIFAENRDLVIRERFIEFGIHRRGLATEAQASYWNSKHILGKKSTKFFLKLVSGMPLHYMLYQMCE